MSAVACILSLIAACMCIAFGVVRIGNWLIYRLEEQATKAIRDAAFVAQARAEIAHRDYTISMLDQQHTHCADDFPGYAELFLDDSVAGQPEVRHV